MANKTVLMNLDAIISESARKMGFIELKEEQRHVLRKFAEGNDVFVCLPTGFGKSLCYQCLPTMFDLMNRPESDSPWSVIIVVSPLSALMEDQVTTLATRGIKAVKCTNADDDKQLISEGNFQIIFTTPEVLLNKNWSDVFRCESLCQRLVAFVVDEAHCIKKW